MDTNSVDKNYDWFTKNLSDLVKQHDGEYVVIKNCMLIGAYKSFEEAWDETTKKEKAGTFIIQLCSEDKSKTTHTYFTNKVSFS